jgi:hypothetical protein
MLVFHCPQFVHFALPFICRFAFYDGRELLCPSFISSNGLDSLPIIYLPMFDSLISRWAGIAPLIFHFRIGLAFLSPCFILRWAGIYPPKAIYSCSAHV